MSTRSQTVDEIRGAMSLEHQARLLASVGHAVIATDSAGTIRFWNPAAEELYGWTAAEVMGRDITKDGAGTSPGSKLPPSLPSSRARAGRLSA